MGLIVGWARASDAMIGGPLLAVLLQMRGLLYSFGSCKCKARGRVTGHSCAAVLPIAIR